MYFRCAVIICLFCPTQCVHTQGMQPGPFLGMLPLSSWELSYPGQGRARDRLRKRGEGQKDEEDEEDEGLRQGRVAWSWMWSKALGTGAGNMGRNRQEKARSGRNANEGLGSRKLKVAGAEAGVQIPGQGMFLSWRSATEREAWALTTRIA